MKLVVRIGMLLLLSLALPGCLKGLLPKAQDRAVYTLPEPAKITAARALPGAVLVEPLQALAPLDGEDVLIRREDGEVQTLPGVRWAAPISVLLQDLIARQIEVAGAAPGVTQTAQVVLMPFRLSGDLRAFEMREAEGRLAVHTEIVLRLVCTGEARILATSEPISVDATSGPNTPQSATAALREAGGLLARQSVFWLAKVDASGCVEP